MNASRSSSSGGIGFAGLLTVAFVVLKLLDKIQWSWWWVLSPILISAFFVILGLGFLVVVEVRERRKWRELVNKWKPGGK